MATTRSQVIDNTIYNIVFCQCSKVVIPPFLHLQAVCAVFKLRYTFDGTGLGEGIVALHGRETVEDKFKDSNGIADFKAFKLRAAVREYSGTLACDHRVDKLAELQQKICAVSSIFPQKNLLQFFRGVFG